MLARLPFGRIPVQHSKTEIAPRDALLSPTSGPKDPFIYNPRLRAAAASQVGSFATGYEGAQTSTDPPCSEGAVGVHLDSTESLLV